GSAVQAAPAEVRAGRDDLPSTLPRADRPRRGRPPAARRLDRSVVVGPGPRGSQVTAEPSTFTSIGGRSMVRITISGRATFRAERLEDRCAPAGLPWPVAAADIVGIAATYGQFDNRLYGPDREGWIHFHEGIDIEVTAGTGVVAVRAIEGGTVSLLALAT